MIRRLMAVLLSAAVVLLWAAPANAFTVFTMHDSFEANPTNWTFQRSGTGDGKISYDSRIAHTGSGFANISSMGSGAFSSVGLPVHLTPGATFCTLSAVFSPESFSPDGHNYVNMEVINPTSWTYIALKTLDFRSISVWPAESLTWIQSATDIYIRFSVLGSTDWRIRTWIDDVSVTCSSPF